MSAVIARQQIPVTKYIYNHDIMNCTDESVVGNHLYSGRALGITEPWDMIQLHEDLKPLWPDINKHYRRIGLRHAKEVVWFLNLKQIGAHVGYQPSVFYFGPNEYRCWGDYEWLESVEYLSSKNNFMTLARELGVDTPKTTCFDSISKIDDAAMTEIPCPCYLKPASSVLGSGIFRCENEAELMKACGQFSDDVAVQVQEAINSHMFLNLHYKITGNELIRLAASEKIPEGIVNQGNRMPARYAPWDTVEPMALWLKEHGMRGIFAFDVAVIQTNRGLRFPAIGCHPHYIDATYPMLIAQKLNIPEWSAKTFMTRYRNLTDINLNDIEYDQFTGEGAIIVNWGTVLAGKLTILMAGSKDYQDALEIELLARL
jgi:hypothetical protein